MCRSKREKGSLIGEQKKKQGNKWTPQWIKAVSIITQRQGDKVLLLFSLLFLNFYLGYYGEGVNAIIVFAACFLPDSDRGDYHEIMENLFLWVEHCDSNSNFFPRKNVPISTSSDSSGGSGAPSCRWLGCGAGRAEFHTWTVQSGFHRLLRVDRRESWHVWEFWTGLKRGETVASPLLGCQMARGLRSRLKPRRPDCSLKSVGDGVNCHETDCCSSLLGPVSRADLDQGERGESQTETKVIRGFTAGKESEGVLAENIVGFLFLRSWQSFPLLARRRECGRGVRR